MVEPSTSSCLAPVRPGQPRYSARALGTKEVRASVDSDPQTTMSGSTRRMAASRTLAVLKAQEPWRASSWTWTAASGPMDSALRTVARAEDGPMQRTTTSPPCCSLSRRASSTAYSSTGFRIVSTDSRSSVLSAGSRRFSAAVSGTRLTVTRIFNAASRGWPVPDGVRAADHDAATGRPFARAVHSQNSGQVFGAAYSVEHDAAWRLRAAPRRPRKFLECGCLTGVLGPGCSRLRAHDPHPATAGAAQRPW